MPVACDVDAAAHPHALVGFDVIEELLQGLEAPWPTEQAAVHADAEYLW